MSTTTLESLEKSQPHNRLSAEPMVTHVIIGGVACAVWDMPRIYGFTYEERKQTLDQNSHLATHCYLGGVALSLEQFEAEHPHIQLGQE